MFIGAVYVYVTLFTAEMYLQETAQQLNQPLAEQLAQIIEPFVGITEQEDSLQNILLDAATLNPALEIHLLDPSGNILNSTVAHKLMIEAVPLEPVKRFLKSDGKIFALGEDPCGLVKEKVFSVAAITRNDRLLGYLYLIVHGKEYDSLTERLLDSYILRLGLRSLSITLLSALAVAVVVLALLTRKLRRITVSVKSFEQGDYYSRIHVKSNDELDQLGRAFNSMADTILRDMNQLKEADSQRRELVANLSHDLKTPITSIQGYVETLLMKGSSLPTETQLQYLQIILSGTERLRKLAQQVLELSRLEGHETKPNFEPFAILELIHDIVQKFQPQAEKQKIRLHALAPSLGSGLLVYADIGMIERVLQNLIENALRYTMENGCISLELNRKENNVEVRIADTGRGISSEDIPYIFDRFYRSEKSRSSELGGTGLGLAIVQRILAAHGVAIQVESTVGKGTVFSFHLPVYQK